MTGAWELAGWGLGAVVVAVLLRAGIHRAFRAPQLKVSTDPGRFGMTFENVTLSGAGGKRLAAWYIAPSAPDGPCVAIIHGWGANGAVMLPLVARMHRAGIGALVIDARNHGRSDADDFSSMPRFAEDLEAGLVWLEGRDGHGPVVVLGHSVGAAAAILVASRADGVSAAVALAPFAHPETVMRRFMARAHVPFWPIGWAINRYVERVIGHRFEAIAPINAIARARCPVLIVHGDADAAVPVADAMALRDRAPKRVRLEILAGADHFADGRVAEVAAIVADFVSSPGR